MRFFIMLSICFFYHSAFAQSAANIYLETTANPPHQATPQTNTWPQNCPKSSQGCIETCTQAEKNYRDLVMLSGGLNYAAINTPIYQVGEIIIKLCHSAVATKNSGDHNAPNYTSFTVAMRDLKAATKAGIFGMYDDCKNLYDRLQLLNNGSLYEPEGKFGKALAGIATASAALCHN